MRTINWNDLPHNRQLGYGHEGLVLRLSETRSIKIYSPERVESCDRERINLELLARARMPVPQVSEKVTIRVGRQPIKLPSRCEFSGIGLYTFDNIESVPALIKDYIPGKPYGTTSATILQARRLFRYLHNAHEKGFAFPDCNITNFIDGPDGPVLVDASHLFTRDTAKPFDDYCHQADEQIVHDWRSELLSRNLLSEWFDFKVGVANYLAR